MSIAGEPLHVILVEDSSDDVALILRELRNGGYTPVHRQVQTADQFREALAEQAWDIIISDYSMPHFSGLAALEICNARDIHIPFILVSGTVGEAEAVQAMKAGAQDYLMKDNLSRLAPAVRRERQEAYARRERLRTEARLSSILDTAADAIIGIDDRQQIVFFNQGAEKIFHYKTEEILGKPIDRLLLPSPQTPHRAVFEQLSALPKDAQTRQKEVIARRKEGQRFPAEVSMAAFTQDDGLYHTLILRDISDRKQAEIALRQADRRAIQQYEQLLQRLIKLAQAFGAAPDLLAVYRALATFIEESAPCNGLFIAMYDPTDQLRRCVYTVSEKVEEDPSQLPPLPLNEGPQSRAIISGDAVVVDDLQPLHANLYPVNLGLERDPRLPQSCVAVPMSVKGRIIGVFEAQSVELAAYNEEHITALRMAANLAAVAIENSSLLEKTKEQARHVQSVLDAVPDAVLLLDATFHIVLANPVARNILPLLTAEEHEPLSYLGNRPLNAILKSFQSGDNTMLEELHVERPRRVFEVAARPVAQDATEGWVIVLRDVTESRERQEHLQRQERLATVGQLAAGIAHDFNNVLAIIMLYSDTLMRTPDHVRRMRYLQTIRDQSEHAANLISQILDFSRRSVMERTTLDLLALMQESTALLQRTMPENIDIRLEADDDNYICEADPTRLRQLLVNLAVNARDAMPDGGEMALSLSKTQVAPHLPPFPNMRPGQWLRITVRDNGHGVSEEALPHLFEPFFTTKQPGKGTGLGLAQVYGIVKQHGGEIGVESEQGRGTIFTIYLPLKEGLLPEQEAVELPPIPHQGAGETILLVEDDERTRHAIAETLELLGYEVIVAANGKDALQVYAMHDGAFDLVLTDMIMPEMGGLDFQRALLEKNPDIKIILMTGYPLGDSGRTTLEHGAITWIQKPFTMRALAHTIRRKLAF